MSRHDSARSTCRASRAVLFQYGGRRTSYSARLYKFSRSYALTHTQILFVPSNKIIVYSNKLVNNLHITITLYKLHNKLSCESRLSRSSCRTCRARRARRVERVEPCCSTSSTQPKCMGSTRRTCPVVSCRGREEPSGIWVYLIIFDFLVWLYCIKMDFSPQKYANKQASIITEPEKFHNSQLPSDRTLNARHYGCWDEQNPHLRKLPTV